MSTNNPAPYPQIIVQRWTLLLLGLASVPLALASVALARVVVAEIDFLGVGATAGVFRLVYGAAAFYCMSAVPYKIWRDALPDSPLRLFGREAVIWLVVLPMCMLLGRVAFSYIPPWEPVIGCILLPLLAKFFLKDVGKPAPTSADPEYRRGFRVMTPEEAVKKLSNLSPGSDPPIRWAGFDLPASSSEDQFCVVGAPGSGKTLLMRSLIASIVPHIKPGTDRRAIVYDVKLDLVSHLQDMGITCPIHILNPFDTRCVAWDMAGDMTDPDIAVQYAGILVPENKKESNVYFTNAARELIGGALKAFIIRRIPWTLRDLILVTTNKARLQQVLASTPYTAGRIEQFFKPEDTFHNVLSTIANAMGPLESVAAIWHSLPSERRISLNRWCSEECSILVLGSQFDRGQTLTLLNEIIFRRLSDVMLSRQDVLNKRWATWFFIDELKDGGHLSKLPRLLTNGRSKGVRVAIGFQDIEGLRETYGEHLANEMPGMCGYRSILNLRSSFTAQWASDQLGEVERFEYVTSIGTATDKDANLTRNQNTTQQIETRRALLPSEFMSFASATAGQVFGCHILSSINGAVPRITEHSFHTPRPLDNFSPRTNIDEMLLPPWTADDYRRLGLAPPPEEHDETSPPPPTSPPRSPLDSIGRLTRNPPKDPGVDHG